jgi:hypothetical protein
MARTSQPAEPGAAVWVTEAVDAGGLYASAFTELTEHGERAAPRGQPTLEVGLAALTLGAPGRRLAAVYGRQLNPFLILAEILWILAGRDDVAFVSRFSGRIAGYAPTEGNIFPDAYGPRLRRGGGVNQLAAVIDVLRRDRDTRRALMSFWVPAVDSVAGAHAVPCNIALDFKLRDDGLRLTVFNRSNDLHIGLLFNLAQFGLLAEVVASRLGVTVVRQTHVSTSLHVYTESQIHQRLLGRGIQAAPLYDHVDPLPVGALDDGMLGKACSRLDSEEPADPRVPLEWCIDSPWLTGAVLLLDAHRAFEAGREIDDYTTALALLARVVRCDWWVLAAEMFARRLHRRQTPGAARARAALEELVRPLNRELVRFIAAAGGSAEADSSYDLAQSNQISAEN